MQQHDQADTSRYHQEESRHDLTIRHLLVTLLSDHAGLMARFGEEFGISLSSLFHHSLGIHAASDVKSVVEHLVTNTDVRLILRLMDDMIVHQMGLLGAMDQIGQQVLSQLVSEDPAGVGFLGKGRTIKQRISYYATDTSARQRDMIMPGFVIGYRSARENARLRNRSK